MLRKGDTHYRDMEALLEQGYGGADGTAKKDKDSTKKVKAEKKSDKDEIDKAEATTSEVAVVGAESAGEKRGRTGINNLFYGMCEGLNRRRCVDGESPR